MNEAPQHQIHDPLDQALCADIAAYLRSIDKYFPDFDQLPDVKAVRKLTARFICDLENKYPGTAVTAGMMLAMYDLHGHLIEDEQPIESEKPPTTTTALLAITRGRNPARWRAKCCPHCGAQLDAATGATSQGRAA